MHPKVTKTNRSIIIDRMQLADLLLAAAQTALAGVQYAPYMSQNKAYESYGTANVKNWVKWGKVNIYKDGDRNCIIRLSRLELEASAQASNRCEYFLNL
jgi:hypothetical protein